MTIKKSMTELQRMDVASYQESYSENNVLILENVRSAYNVGSIFRSADCFGISKIYLCGITCKTDHRELQKTALGAELSVASEYTADIQSVIRLLKEAGYTIIALEQTHESLSLSTYEWSRDGKYAFIFGNEVEGVSEEVLSMSDIHIEIPQIGTKHSLNIANAASILLWEVFRRFH